MSPTFRSRPAEPRLAAALERLDGLVDWERWERSRGSVARMRVSVEPMTDLDRRLGLPSRAFRHVHVAGTKGKGSVAALIAAGLRRLDTRTGVYASPHVERVNERVVVDGAPLADGPLAAAIEEALAARERALEEGTVGRDATWFDVLTAAAFVAMRAAGVEWAVVECGLGGRLDSTNVLAPGPCVLTNVDLEHTAVLGRTRAAIAREKAGILKPGGLAVSGVGQPDPDRDEAAAVVRATAAERGVRLVEVALAPGETLEERNARLAGALLDELGRGPLVERRVREATGAEDRPPGAWLLDGETRRAARLPGRLERFAPAPGVELVLDGAHVPSSLRDVLRELGAGPGRSLPAVIFGTGREKDADQLLKVLRGRTDRVLCTTAGRGPYRTPGELFGVAVANGIAAEEHGSPSSALARALELAAGGGLVLGTGSLHLVGALRGLLTDPGCSPSSRT